MTNTNNWNIERVGAVHINKAEDAKRYLKELKTRIQKNDPRADMSKFEFDKTLAKYTLYNHLCDRSYFETKEVLRVKLERLETESFESTIPPYNLEEYKSAFERECNNYLSNLIKHES